MSKPDIQCKRCGWQGYDDNDTPEGGLLKIYKGETGWLKEYDPHNEGMWACPKCHLPEEGGVMAI